MITAWRLANFKCVRGPVELALAPLTCITGANSSGKSSVLQSMLMLAQTTRYSPSWVPLALNGPMVNLGTLDEVRTRGAAGDAVLQVGFDFRRHEEIQPRHAGCDLEFDGGDESDLKDNARPSLRRAAVNLRVTRSGRQTALRGTASRVSADTAVQRIGRTMTIHGSDEASHLHRYEMTLEEANQARGLEVFEGVSLQHFLPNFGVVEDAAGEFNVRPLAFNSMVQHLLVGELTGMRALLAERVATRMIHPRVNTASPDDVGL